MYVYVYILGIMKQVFARLRNGLSRSKFLKTVVPLVLAGVCIGSPIIAQSITHIIMHYCSSCLQGLLTMRYRSRWATAAFSLQILSSLVV